MLELNLDLENAMQEIKKRKAKRIVLQLPEGLKTKAVELIKELEKTGTEVICLTDPCFGACDLAEYKANALGADLIIHLGHEKMIACRKSIFVPLEYRIREDVLRRLKKEFNEKLREKKIIKIGLAGSAQYLNYLKKFKSKEVSVFFEKNKAGIQGQVLGCDVSALKKLEKKVHAIAFIGDGLFHPLAISFAVKKPLLLVNPLNEKVEWLEEGEKDKLLRKRILMIEKARKAKSFGILVSTKKGQMKLNKAIKAKKLIEGNGKKAFIFASDFILPEYLLGVNIECFVSTACPRIALEDFLVWKKPIINTEELKILFKKKKIDEYCFEELI